MAGGSFAIGHGEEGSAVVYSRPRWLPPAIRSRSGTGFCQTQISAPSCSLSPFYMASLSQLLLPLDGTEEAVWAGSLWGADRACVQVPLEPCLPLTRVPGRLAEKRTRARGIHLRMQGSPRAAYGARSQRGDFVGAGQLRAPQAVAGRLGSRLETEPKANGAK